MPEWEKHLLQQGVKKRRTPSRLTPSEIMTLFIYFHICRYRDFKTYYTRYVRVYLCREFPGLVSYCRMVSLLKSVLIPLCVFIQTLSGEKTGIYFIDSLIMKVCHIKRAHQHRVFKELAKKSVNIR
jgi:hypothetical protein